MLRTKPLRLVWAAGLVLVAAVLNAPATAVAEQPLRPPKNLEVTAVYSDAVYLSWEPGSDDPGLAYKIYKGGWSRYSEDTSYRWDRALGLRAGEAHSFVVTHITKDPGNDDESAPSNEVTVTVPHPAPVDDLTATLSGDTVTLTWSRPDTLDPGLGNLNYGLRLNGDPEALLSVSSSEESVVRSFPLPAPGPTHEYTVENWRGGVGDPALLSVPTSDDTTPPTAPSWRTFCLNEEPYTIRWEIVEESTDDTTPQPEIRYELRQGFSLVSDDFPLSGENFEDFGFPGDFSLRALDEAGNRSGLVSPIVECP